MLVRVNDVKEKYYVNSTKEGIEFILKKFAKSKLDKSFILTGDDVTVSMLDAYYDKLKDYFYFYNAGAVGRIGKYMNKNEMIRTASKYGMNIIKTWSVKTGDIPEDIIYPVMTKATNSIGNEWKDIVYICHNDEELNAAFLNIKSDYILVQQYIEKKDEISFDAFSVNQGKDIFFVIEANQIYNLSDKYSPYWKIKNSDNKEIQKKISKIIEEIGFEGIFEFEFIKDKNGKLWFLEINFRNTALGFATTVAGMPQVVYWCESMINGFIDKEKYYRKISTELIAMAECFDYDVRVKKGIISKKEWKKQFDSAQCKMYKGRNDNIPFFIFMWYKLMKMNKKKRRIILKKKNI